MTIGSRIREYRKKLGLSVDDVADKLCKNRATVYRYESDDIENLPASVLEPLAQILHTTPAELMGWKRDCVDTRPINHNNYKGEKTDDHHSFSPHEVSLITKYRQLDDAACELVDSMIDKLHEQRFSKFADVSNKTISS